MYYFLVDRVYCFAMSLYIPSNEKINTNTIGLWLIAVVWQIQKQPI